jgi:hypothetical protein
MRRVKDWCEVALSLQPELAGESGETLESLGRAEFCLACGRHLGAGRSGALAVVGVKPPAKGVGWVCPTCEDRCLAAGYYEPLMTGNIN